MNYYYFDYLNRYNSVHMINNETCYYYYQPISRIVYTQILNQSTDVNSHLLYHFKVTIYDFR